MVRWVRECLKILTIGCLLGLCMQVPGWSQDVPLTHVDSSSASRIDSTQIPQSQTTNPVDSTRLSQEEKNKRVTQLSDIGSYWELLKLGGWFGWPMGILFILGIILIVGKTVAFIFEYHRSKMILTSNVGVMTLEEITETIDKSPNNLIKSLFQMLLEIFETTGQSTIFNEEINNYIKYQEDRFSTFKTRILFISDTEGALGLLGTVWGMFVTFFGGNLDKQVILDGMGIALITTLMGLIASVILNFCLTEIYSFFNKLLANIQDKADEFRIRISKIEKSRQKKVETERRLLEYEVEKSQGNLSEPAAIQPHREICGPPFKLAYVSGDGQHGVVNSRLHHPLVVELLDTFENCLAGQVIRFSIEKGDGNLSNGGKVQELVTDREGRVTTYLTVGIRSGENVVRTSARGLNGQYVEFLAHGQAGLAENMVLVSGNNLAGNAGTRLEEPFVVAVRDAFENPIPDFQVSYKVTMGNGSFTGNTSNYMVVTDANGLAHAYFTLGTKKGFNRVLVTAKKLRRAKIEIQALGQ